MSITVKWCLVSSKVGNVRTTSPVFTLAGQVGGEARDGAGQPTWPPGHSPLNAAPHQRRTDIIANT